MSDEPKTRTRRRVLRENDAAPYPSKRCKNCHVGTNPALPPNLVRGLCPTCFAAFRLALEEIKNEAATMRNHYRSFGDESGDAAANACQRIVVECKNRMRASSS